MPLTPEQKEAVGQEVGSLTGAFTNSLWNAATEVNRVVPAPYKIPMTIILEGSTSLLPGGVLDNPALYGAKLGLGLIAGVFIAGAGLGFGPLLAAGVGAAYIIDKSLDYFYSNNTLGFKDIIDTANDLGSAAFESATQMVEDMGEAIGGAIDAIGQAISDAGEAIIENAEALASLVETAFRDAWAGLQQLYNELPSFDELFTDWSEAFDRISDYLENLWGKLIGEEQCEVEDLETAAGLTPQTPIVLDMNGNGIELKALNESRTMFDIDNDGFLERTGWVKNGDALLAYDANNNGKIDNHSELFGTEKSGTRIVYGDGFDKLTALFDSNGDNVINAADTNFNKLLVWVDADGNGISTPDELKTLSQAGITSISLNEVNDVSGNHIAGHDIVAKSTFIINGQIRNAWDMAFDVSQMHSSYKLPDGFTYAPDIAALPQIRGFGTTKDLWVAMTEDATLKTMVRTLMDKDYTSFSFNSFKADVEAILLRWTGAEGQTGSYNGMIENRHLKAIESWSGTKVSFSEGFHNKGKLLAKEWDEVVNDVATKFLVSIPSTSLYEASLASADIYSQLVADGVNTDAYTSTDWANLYGTLFADAIGEFDTHPLKQFAAIEYNYINDKLVGNFTTLVTTLAAAQPAEAVAKAAYWDNYLPILNAIADSQNLSDAAFDAAFANTYMANAYDTPSTLRSHGIISGTDASDYLKGSNGNDYLASFKGNIATYHDTLEGGKGNDRMEDGSPFGNDTYIYRLGDGADTINDQGDVNDVLRLEGIAMADVIVRQAEYDQLFQNEAPGYGNDLELVIKDGGSILLENFLLPTPVDASAERNNRIETIIFSNGTLNASQLEARAQQQTITNGNDIVRDLAISVMLNETIDASPGNDIFQLINGGTNMLDYNLGDGFDVIYGDASANIIRFGTGISYASVNAVLMGYDLAIQINNNDVVYIKNYTNAGITRFEFVEGGVQKTLNELYNEKILQPNITSAKDYIEIQDITNLTISGGLGNDTLHYAETGVTYAISAGEGMDWIYNYDRGSAYNSLHLNGINFSQATFHKLGSSLVIETGSAANNRIIIESQFGTSAYQINNFIFADQTVTWNNINALVMANTSGNDSISGSSGVNDILNGGSGNDTLYGGTGNDSFIYNVGDGYDYITENFGQGADQIRFGVGLTLNNLIISRPVNPSFGAGIVLEFIGQKGGIWIQNQFYNNSTAIENFVFDNGAQTLTSTELFNRYFTQQQTSGDDFIQTFNGWDNTLVNGGAGHDNIIGYGDNEILNGGDGNDSIIAEDAADTINGGTGNDFIQANFGKDSVTGGTGFDVIEGGYGNDILYGDEGHDMLYGGNDSDTLYGGIGHDTLYGDAGNDLLDAGDGMDMLYGGIGNDTLRNGSGIDYLTGNSGADLFRILKFANAHTMVRDFYHLLDGELIDLTAFGQNQLLYYSVSGNGLTIQLPDNQKLTLEQFSKVNLNVSDFIGVSQFIDLATLSTGADTVSATDAQPLTFTASDVSAYGTGLDNGSFALKNIGRDVELTGDAWKKAAYTYDVTENTILTFQYRVLKQGGIHGISLETDNDHTNGQPLYQLYGTNTSSTLFNRDYDYTTLGAWQNFTIRVGEDFTGSINSIGFINDGFSSTFAQFRDIMLYEDVPVEPTFNYLTINPANLTSYESQDKAPILVEILDEGKTLHLEGDTWKKLALNTTVTANTMLRFDFKSEQPGEIHAIGFSPHNKVNSANYIQLLGSQNFGQNGPDYTGAGNWQSFEIDLSDHYAVGSNWAYMVFISDDDATQQSDSWFKNIAIYEEVLA